MCNGNPSDPSVRTSFLLLLLLICICLAFPRLLEKHGPRSGSVVVDKDVVVHLRNDDNPARDPQNVIPKPFPSSNFHPYEPSPLLTPSSSKAASPSFQSESEFDPTPTPPSTHAPSGIGPLSSHPSKIRSSVPLQTASHRIYPSSSPQAKGNVKSSSVAPSKPLTKIQNNDPQETSTGELRDCIYFGSGEVPGFTSVKKSWMSGNVTTYTASPSAFPNLPKQFLSYAYADMRFDSVWTVTIPVPPDRDYSLSLGFAETNNVACSYEKDTGFRVFRVSLFGQSEIVDVMNEVGCGVPFHLRINSVSVTTSGMLRLSFEGITESAMISTVCYSPTMAGQNPSPSASHSKESQHHVSVFPTISVTPDSSFSPDSKPRYTDIIQPGAGSFSCINFGSMHLPDYKKFNLSSTSGDVELYTGRKVTQHKNLPLAYQSFIFGKNWSYKLNLPTASFYTIVLGFVETSPAICAGQRFAGQRVFTVNLASGMQIVDVMASVGCATPYQSFFESVSSTDGVIDITFKALSGSAMLSVICYSDVSKTDSNFSSQSPSPTSSPPFLPYVSASASQNIAKDNEDDGNENNSKDSEFMCFNFGGNAVSGFKTVDAPRGNDDIGSYLGSKATVYPNSPHFEVYRSHLFGLELSLNIASDADTPKSFVMGFAETYSKYCEYDARVFDVRVGPIMRTIDVFREVGCSKPFNIRIDGVLPDSNGMISITLSSRSKHAMISGICVQDGTKGDELRQYLVPSFPNPTSRFKASKISVQISASTAPTSPTVSSPSPLSSSLEQSEAVSISPEPSVQPSAVLSRSPETFLSLTPSPSETVTPFISPENTLFVMGSISPSEPNLSQDEDAKSSNDVSASPELASSSIQATVSVSPNPPSTEAFLPSQSLVFAVEADPKPTQTSGFSALPSTSPGVMIVEAESPTPSTSLLLSLTSPTFTPTSVDSTPLRSIIPSVSMVVSSVSSKPSEVTVSASLSVSPEASLTTSTSIAPSQRTSTSIAPSQSASTSIAPSQSASTSIVPSQSASTSIVPSQSASTSIVPSQSASTSIAPSQSAYSSIRADISESPVSFPTESFESVTSPTSSSISEASQPTSELLSPTLAILISTKPSASESFSISPEASIPPSPLSSVTASPPTIILAPSIDSASMSSTPLMSVSSSVTADASQMPGVSTPPATPSSSQENSDISSSPLASSGLEIVPGPSISSSFSMAIQPTPESSKISGTSISSSPSVWDQTSFPSPTLSASQTMDESGPKDPESNPSPSFVIIVGVGPSLTPSSSTLPSFTLSFPSSLGPSTTVSPFFSIQILPSGNGFPSQSILASTSPTYSLLAAASSEASYSMESPDGSDEVFVTFSAPAIQSEEAELYASFSLEPSPSYDANIYIEATPWVEEPLASTPAAQSPDVMVGVGDDSGIVQDSSSDDVGPTIVEGSPWKELIGTGAAGKAFPVLMGITGFLLVMLLLVCLFFAIFRSGPVSYSYLSQYSAMDRNRTGYEDDRLDGNDMNGVGLAATTESFSEADNLCPPFGYKTQQTEPSSPGYESPLHTGSAYFYEQRKQDGLSEGLDNLDEHTTLDAQHLPTGVPSSTCVDGLEEHTEVGNIYVGTNDLSFEQSHYENNAMNSEHLSHLSNPLQTTVFDNTLGETLDALREHEHSATLGNVGSDVHGHTIENGHYGPSSALYQEERLSGCQQSPNMGNSKHELDHTLPPTELHEEDRDESRVPSAIMMNINVEMNNAEVESVPLPRSVADDYVSCGSNPAVTPYESGMEADHTVVDWRCSERNKRRAFIIHRESRAADSTMLDNADVEEFEHFSQLKKSGRFLVNREGKPPSEVSTAEGPWPVWWAHENAHTHIHEMRPPEEEGDDDSYCNSSQIADSNETEASKENSSLPSNDDRDVSNFAHETSGGVIHENIDPRTAGAMFGGGQLLSDNAWMRQSGTNESEIRSPNPEFDYLRKRREPYVKAVANRLSMGLPRQSGEGNELAELAVHNTTNSNSFDEICNYTIDHYNQQL